LYEDTDFSLAGSAAQGCQGWEETSETRSDAGHWIQDPVIRGLASAMVESEALEYEASEKLHDIIVGAVEQNLVSRDGQIHVPSSHLLSLHLSIWQGVI
jgi:hypothetical protein